MECKKCGGKMVRSKGYIFMSFLVGLAGALFLGMGDQLIVFLWIVAGLAWGLGHRKRVCKECGYTKLKK